MSSRTQSVVLALAALGFSAAAFYQSTTWGLERTAIGPAAISPDGLYVAQFYTLPERSEWPYGMGVYVSPRFVPVWLHADLVFASHCRRGSLTWTALRTLAVECERSETGASPTALPAPGGILVLPIRKVPSADGRNPEMKGKAMLGKLRKVIGGLKAPGDPAILVSKGGFNVSDQTVLWERIQEIAAYKVDLVTVDEVRLHITLVSGSTLVLSEEQVGFHDLIASLAAEFPSLARWQNKLLRPAFARNETVLYRRA